MRRFSIALLLFACSCGAIAPVPIVPRWDEPGHSTRSIDADEQQLWDESRERREALEKQGLIVVDLVLTSYLDGVLATLISEPLPDYVPMPKVQAMRSPLRNALAQPDGGILITTSLLAAIRNEAQLAAVIGHELGHFLARHSLVEKRFEQVSRSTVERMQLSRQNETECDRFALGAMQLAGYDAREMPRVLQLMETEDSSQSDPSSYAFRSHPFLRERVRDIDRQVVDPQESANRVGAASYDDAIATLLPAAAETELEAGQLAEAESTIERYLLLKPESGRGYFLKAEHARLVAPDGGRSESVRLAYERAVELAPDDARAVKALGLLCYDNGEVARAMDLFGRYLQLAPDAVDRKLVQRYLSGIAPTE